MRGPFRKCKLHNLQNISACYFLFRLQIRFVEVHFDLSQLSSLVLFADELELYDQDTKERKLGLATGEIKLKGRLQRFVQYYLHNNDINIYRIYSTISRVIFTQIKLK